MVSALSETSPVPVKTNFSGKWFTEWFSADESHMHRFKKTIVETKTKFQHAIVADSRAFGRCLILDGELQSAESDEFIYHECLVHPAMVTHPAPKTILVLGGGEGATVREILRHPGVQHVTMVDIDAEVVNFCRKYLKEWHQGSFSHPKLNVVIADAFQFVMNTRETYDVIFSDLPTPADTSAVYGLYTVDFYQKLTGRLNPGGVLTVQAGSGSPQQFSFHAILANTLKRAFKQVRACYAFVPSFDVPWAFLTASSRSDPAVLKAKEVDKRLGTLKRVLRFYDGQTHEGLFRIPKYMRSRLEQERRILTAKKKILHFK